MKPITIFKSSKGAPVQLHWSIFVLFLFLFGPTIYYNASALTAAEFWLSNAYFVLLFGLLFASVIAHEIGHSYVGERLGFPVEKIVLFFLGGAAVIRGIPNMRPRQEIHMALGGPLVSLMLFFMFAALWTVGIQLDFNSKSLSALWLLAFINVLMAAFNMLPCFPLDGGRVLRGILRSRISDDKADVLVGKTTKVCAFIAGIVFLYFGWIMAVVIMALIFMMGDPKMESKYASNKYKKGHGKDYGKDCGYSGYPELSIEQVVHSQELIDQYLTETQGITDPKEITPILNKYFGSLSRKELYMIQAIMSMRTLQKTDGYGKTED
jgi:Zn-dependent protease